MSYTALIIDDNKTERRFMSRILKNALDMDIFETIHGKEALEQIKSGLSPKIIILDLEMPIMDGRETLIHLKEVAPHIPVIIATASDDMRDAISMMKLGAFDFLLKPLDQDRLIVSARNALKMSILSQEITRLKGNTLPEHAFKNLIGHDAGLMPCIEIAKKATQNKLPVLLSGETGTGKELFARAIHDASPRANAPFIAINCGAIPEKLVESTLFGHEKGAFTGATNKATGKFQEASGGTLFLDEIGELPLDAQVKLLRAVQQKEIEPVGATKPIKTDVRIISATNRDLQTEVSQNQFREDLFFRLNVLNINLPPLRERTEDIKDLAEHFIKNFAITHEYDLKTLHKNALDLLQSHSWPGNVRELENVINRAMALSEDTQITKDDIYVNASINGQNKNNLVKSSVLTLALLDDDGNFKSFKILEQEIIHEAIAYHKHNMTQCAKTLGIAKSTLYAKTNEFEQQ